MAALPEPTAPCPDALGYLRFVAQSTDLAACWRQLCVDLASFGFTRLIYARKPDATVANFHQLWDTLILSTYEPEAEDFLVGARGYAAETTVKWAVEHEGPLDWGQARERFLAGNMSAAEKQIHLKSRELGLIAGYTYGMPLRESGVRSGFALWFHGCDDQTLADRAWTTGEAEIVPRLYAFDIAVSGYRHVPTEQRLSERERAVLQLAAKGKTAREIAELLTLHRRTVEDAMTRARGKLQVATTLQAVLKAEQQGQL